MPPASEGPAALARPADGTEKTAKNQIASLTFVSVSMLTEVSIHLNPKMQQTFFGIRFLGSRGIHGRLRRDPGRPSHGAAVRAVTSGFVGVHNYLITEDLDRSLWCSCGLDFDPPTVALDVKRP